MARSPVSASIRAGTSVVSRIPFLPDRVTDHPAVYAARNDHGDLTGEPDDLLEYAVPATQLDECGLRLFQRVDL